MLFGRTAGGVSFNVFFFVWWSGGRLGSFARVIAGYCAVDDRLEEYYAAMRDAAKPFETQSRVDNSKY